MYEVRYGLREALLGSETIGGGQVGEIKIYCNVMRISTLYFWPLIMHRKCYF